MESPALSSFLRVLSIEKSIPNYNHVTIVVDNAHIPVRCRIADCAAVDSIHDVTEVEGEIEGVDQTFHERMSRSLSDISEMSFPPEFLKDGQHASASKRWESFNSLSCSDVSLSMPHRTSDLDERPTILPTSHRTPYILEEASQQSCPLRERRNRLAPSMSFDSTAKLLAELPIETSSYSSSSTHSVRRVPAAAEIRHLELEFQRDGHNREDRKLEQTNLPSLSSCVLHLVKSETHPKCSPVRRFQGSLEFSTFLERESNLKETTDSLGQGGEVLDEEEGILKQNPEGGSAHVRGSNCHPSPSGCDRWSTESPVMSQTKLHLTPRLSRKSIRTHSDWASSDLKLLTHEFSRRILVDFQVPLSLPSSDQHTPTCIQEDFNQILERTGRFVDLRPSRLDTSQ
jgi:hypothetical protein